MIQSHRRLLVVATVILSLGALLPSRPAEAAGGNIDVANPHAVGYLDVTAARYRADSTGKTDSTAAIQRAVDDARWQCRAVFFPPGVFLVSDTIWCRQGVLKNRHKERTKDPEARAMGLGGAVRGLPCALFGSRRGAKRPVMRLAPNSAGFQDPKKAKPVVRFWRGAVGNPEKEQTNASFEQMFVNIDIEIGPGNAGAIGIHHQAAQGSGVQDCTVDATHGFAGLKGGAGSGGGHANVTVIGGQYGAYIWGAQPAPTITGFTLLGQQKCALAYAGWQTLTAVGVHIVSESRSSLIRTTSWPGSYDTYGQFSLVDSVIVSRGAGASESTGITAGANVYLNNVYMENVRVPAAYAFSGDGAEINGNPKGWLRIPEYAHGIDPDRNRLPFKLSTSVYIDGTRLPGKTYGGDRAIPAARPPSDLQSRHLWSEPFPSWESPGAVSVKASPYNAKGDGKTDDAKAIQRAIDEHEIVFVPRGVYRVSRTIDLRPDTKLIGIHQSFARFRAMVEAEDGSFRDGTNPQPVIRTADSADGQTTLAFLAISASHPATYCLHWRTGRNSILRSVTFHPPSESRRRKLKEGHVSPSHPAVYVSGNGGGRWYNVHVDSFGSRHLDYRHFLIEGTSQPLRFYQCNPEHSMSGCNLEARNAKYLSFYGLKGESPVPICRFLDCDHIRVFGYGGLARGSGPIDTILHFRNTPNFLGANLMDRFMRRERNADKWPMLVDEHDPGTTVALPPLDRPVLYRRGVPLGEPEAGR